MLQGRDDHEFFRQTIPFGLQAISVLPIMPPPFYPKNLGKTAVVLVLPKMTPLMLLRAMSVFCVSSLT